MDAVVSSQLNTSGSEGAHADAAIDTIAGMLRSLSDHTLDLPDANAEELVRLFDRWSRHILVGGPHPLRGDEGSAARDFAGLRQFFRTHRKKEHEYVVSSLRELRSLIWTFVQQVARSLPEETRLENQTKGQIARLQRAVAANSIDELKREALSTASHLERVLEERQRTKKLEIEELSARLQTLRDQLDDARSASETDQLTQIANRRAFDQQLERTSAVSLIYPHKNVLILFDIDHFKKVNDTFGHAGGDAVLRAVALLLVKNFPRKMDCVARFGGEELAVILRESSIGDGKRLAERFLTTLRDFVVNHSGREIRVTASAGIAELGPGEAPEAWLSRADAALYRAKSEGRDRTVTAET